jgi:hypothetical protein
MIAYLSTLVVLIAISALVGLALNLQWGVAGLVNFGVVGFVALGAYATALLAPAFGWYGAMIAAAALCAMVSAVLALLSIRLEENYLAIVTIGFGEVVRILLLNETWLTGGAIGIADIPRPFVSLVSPARYDIVLLLFSLALVAVMFVLLETLVRSPFGRVLRAVRDDATVAAAAVAARQGVRDRRRGDGPGRRAARVLPDLHRSQPVYLDHHRLRLHGSDRRGPRLQYRSFVRRQHHYGAAGSRPLSQGCDRSDRRHAAGGPAPRTDRCRYRPALDPAAARTVSGAAAARP